MRWRCSDGPSGCRCVVESTEVSCVSVCTEICSRDKENISLSSLFHRSNAAAAPPVNKRKQRGKTVPFGTSEPPVARVQFQGADYDAHCAPGSKKDRYECYVNLYFPDYEYSRWSHAAGKESRRSESRACLVTPVFECAWAAQAQPAAARRARRSPQGALRSGGRGAKRRSTGWSAPASWSSL